MIHKITQTKSPSIWSFHFYNQDQSVIQPTTPLVEKFWSTKKRNPIEKFWSVNLRYLFYASLELKRVARLAVTAIGEKYGTPYLYGTGQFKNNFIRCIWSHRYYSDNYFLRSRNNLLLHRRQCRLGERNCQDQIYVHDRVRKFNLKFY